MITAEKPVEKRPDNGLVLTQSQGQAEPAAPRRLAENGWSAVRRTRTEELLGEVPVLVESWWIERELADGATCVDEAVLCSVGAGWHYWPSGLLAEVPDRELLRAGASLALLRNRYGRG